MLVGSIVSFLPAPSPMPSLTSPQSCSAAPPRQTLWWQTPPTTSRSQLFSSASTDPPAAHAPAARRLDRAADALLTRVPATADAAEGALVGIGVIAVAAAVAVEFAASQARHQQVTERSTRLSAALRSWIFLDGFMMWADCFGFKGT